MQSSRTISPGIAWTITGLSLAMIGAGVVIWVMGMVRAGSPIGLFSHQATVPVSGAVFALLGGLVLSRRPRHPIAWILTGLGLVSGVESLDLGILVYLSTNAPGRLIPAPAVVHWVAQWIYVPRGILPASLLLLLFPDGRLPSPRWAPVGWAAVFGGLGSMVTSALAPSSWEALGGIVQNPLAVSSPILDAAVGLAGGLGLLATIGSLASVIVRFNQSTGIERQQLKWLTYAIAVVIMMGAASVVFFAVIPDSRAAAELAFTLVNLSTILIAAAVAIAVLRYRLYNIDVIINRTLVYGTLTGVIVVLYVGIVGALGALFQARGSQLISLAATGLVAVLFQPIRDLLQRWVNRMLYGQRDEPYDVLAQLGRRMEGPSAPEAMLSSIAETVARTLKLPYVAIALPEEDGDRIASESGRPTGEQLRLPLKYQGARVGQLICAPRGPREPFTEAEITLLRDIANQAAVAVHALKLGAALQRSRERLVSAREEERRRLRRDLHDGLGPQLAGLGLKLDAARNQLQEDPRLADAILLQLRWEVQDAIADIRRLVYNLRPPALDELGLIPALRASAVAQLSPAGPRIVVEGPEVTPSLPAAVEVAAFRIAQEAVTNVARHARAQHCTVRLQVENGLELEVLDDGAGLPQPLQAGVGLNSMQERAAELGGWFRIEGRPEGGTRVVAQIPFSSGAA